MTATAIIRITQNVGQFRDLIGRVRGLVARLPHLVAPISHLVVGNSFSRPTLLTADTLINLFNLLVLSMVSMLYLRMPNCLSKL